MNAVPSLYGLVLAGGTSRRMRADKALLEYHGEPELLRVAGLVEAFCAQVYVSVRDEQRDTVRSSLPQIADHGPAIGPAGGILSAAAAHPGRAWLVVACDLPYLDLDSLQRLVTQRDPGCDATAYRSRSDGLPEPLCAIWEPAGQRRLAALVADKIYCPRKTLLRSNTCLLELASRRALDNINTPEEQHAAMREFAAGQESAG